MCRTGAIGLKQDGKYGDKTHAALMDAVADDDEGKQDEPQPATPEVPEEPKPAGATVVIASEGGKVNMRCGNGTEYSRLSSVAPGTTFAYVATAANGWHAVVFNARGIDQSGNEHLGIIEFPVPILRGSSEIIKQIREKLYQPDFQDLTVVDFSDLAQDCKTYDEFTQKMGHVSENFLQYFGVAICGAKKKVNKLTGSMALLR